MSYVVLARKYRPRSFEQMVGQEHVVRALTNALEQQRLHHAYLFTGTRGVGKTTVSRILAKSLNCVGADGSGGITARPCGVCGACTEIDADRYIDYIELDAASNRGIDEIRDLLERAAYKPSTGRFKVFMIDEAHQLTKESFNALLKTLEEPPDYLKFVLATTDPEKMLPTVLSRCLQFNLRPMAPDTVQRHLSDVLDAEGVGHEAAALRLLARAARGSMRDALSLADQAIAYGGGRLEAAAVQSMLGSVDRSHAGGLVEALARRDGRAVLEGIDALRSHGLSAAGTLDEMAAVLQQMAVEQAVPGALDAADPETPRVRQLAALMAADETQLLYSIVVHGRGELDLAPDEYAGLTMVLLRLLAFAPADASEAPLPPTAAAAPARGREALALQAAPSAARASVKAPPSAERAAPTGARALAAGAALPEAEQAVAPRVATGSRAVGTGGIGGIGGSDGIGGVPASPAVTPGAWPAPPTAEATTIVAAAEPMPAVVAPATPVERFEPARNAAGAVPALAAGPSASSAPAEESTPPIQADAAGRREPRAAATRALPEPPAWLDDGWADAPAVEGPSASAPAAEEVAPSPPAAAAAAPAVPAHAGPPATPASSPPLQRSPLGDRWAAIVAGLNERQAVSALARELAMQAEALQADPPAGGRTPVWRLRAERESLRTPALRDKLQAALVALVGHPIELELEAGTAVDSPARRDAEDRQQRQRHAEQVIHNDPLVRQLMAEFKTARIVPGSIKPHRNQELSP